MAHAGQVERSASPAAGLSLAALILLGTRFVQGYIFWGGASRRLIYDFHDVAGVDLAVKLDFDVPGFVFSQATLLTIGASHGAAKAAGAPRTAPRVSRNPTIAPRISS